ncbi:MAG: PAS domain-containing protein [SAR324 cluster bacterium]|nr:PAS domain-containing protein [SAR324 cluster bacterium]
MKIRLDIPDDFALLSHAEVYQLVTEAIEKKSQQTIFSQQEHSSLANQLWDELSHEINKADEEDDNDFIEEKNILQNLIDILPDRIFIKDLQGKFTLCNKEVYLDKERSADLVYGKTVYNYYPKKLADAITKEDQIVFQEGISIKGKEALISTPRGNIWLSTTKVPLRDHNGEIIGLIGVARDITEEKNAQAQLIQSAKLATLGEMATGVAHELNQPLFNISLAANNLIEDVEEGYTNNLIPQLQKIIELVSRASQIIFHLRNYGRDASTTQMKKVNPNQIIENAFTLLNEKIHKNEIKIIKELSGGLEIRCRTIQLEQVFINLLVNALDALKTSPQKQIIIRSFQKENQVVMEVEDTGAGMSEEVQSKIFDSFFTTKEEGQGTGLGLSISNKIIQDHKGRLEVRSSSGQGSIFRISLPAPA